MRQVTRSTHDSLPEDSDVSKTFVINVIPRQMQGVIRSYFVLFIPKSSIYMFLRPFYWNTETIYAYITSPSLTWNRFIRGKALHCSFRPPNSKHSEIGVYDMFSTFWSTPVHNINVKKNKVSLHFITSLIVKFPGIAVVCLQHHQRGNIELKTATMRKVFDRLFHCFLRNKCKVEVLSNNLWLYKTSSGW